MSTEFRDYLRKIIKKDPEMEWESVSDLSSGTSIAVKRNPCMKSFAWQAGNLQDKKNDFRDNSS